MSARYAFLVGLRRERGGLVSRFPGSSDNQAMPCGLHGRYGDEGVAALLSLPTGPPGPPRSCPSSDHLLITVGMGCELGRLSFDLACANQSRGRPWLNARSNR